MNDEKIWIVTEWNEKEDQVKDPINTTTPLWVSTIMKNKKYHNEK